MTLTQLLEAYREAESTLRREESYALPVPTSRHVIAALRAQRIETSTADVKQACELAGLKLADM